MRFLRSLRAYPRLLLSQILIMRREPYYWVVALSLGAISIVAFGYLFNEPSSPRIGVVDEDQSAASRDLVTRFRAIDEVDLSLGRLEHELDALGEGDRWALVFIPKGFGEDLKVQSRIETYYNGDDLFAATTGRGLIRQVVGEASGAPTDGENDDSRIAIDEHAVESEDLPSFIELLVPGMAGMSIMWGNLSAGLWVVWWRQNGVLKRLGTTPLHPLVLELAQVTATLALSVVQVSLLLLLGWLLFGVGVQGSWLALATVILVGILSMIGIGYIFGAFLPNTTAFGGVVNLCAILMLFLGGSYQPIRDAPAALDPLTAVVPLTYLNEALREIMNRGSGLEEVWREIAILAGWAVASAVVSTRVFRWT